MGQDSRKHMGKRKAEVIIPVATSVVEFDDNYIAFIKAIKNSIKEERLNIVIQANRKMILLYWMIGDKILDKQNKMGWGAKVIDRMAKDLQEAFPEMRGFSARNLKYMRKLAECWPDYPIVQEVIAQIPWSSNISLMDKIKDSEQRLWYAKKTIENGWSKSVLDLQIATQLSTRQGKAINNFEMALPPVDSDMATNIFKDPYLFDFLGTDELRREKELEDKLTQHIEKFLLELGQGFAFVGRQVHLEVGNQDFYIDLLFYHLKLRCYVVVELKACDFEPGFVSQLTMYQNIVDDLLSHPDDKPTIGLLLVKGKNKTIVEYSLFGYNNPIGVAGWEQQLTKELPEDMKSSLPSIEEIEQEITD